MWVDTHLLEFWLHNLEAFPVVLSPTRVLKESGNDKTALLCGGERKVETGVEERGGDGSEECGYGWPRCVQSN
jgi:hypothetical protein